MQEESGRRARMASPPNDPFARQLFRIERRLDELESLQIKSSRILDEDLGRLTAKVGSIEEEGKIRHEKIKKFLRNCVLCSEIKQYTSFIESKFQDLQNLVNSEHRTIKAKPSGATGQQRESTPSRGSVPDSRNSNFKRSKTPVGAFVAESGSPVDVSTPSSANNKRFRESSKKESHLKGETVRAITPTSSDKKPIKLGQSPISSKSLHPSSPHHNDYHMRNSNLGDKKGVEESTSLKEIQIPKAVTIGSVAEIANQPYGLLNFPRENSSDIYHRNGEEKVPQPRKQLTIAIPYEEPEPVDEPKISLNFSEKKKSKFSQMMQKSKVFCDQSETVNLSSSKKQKIEEVSIELAKSQRILEGVTLVNPPQKEKWRTRSSDSEDSIKKTSLSAVFGANRNCDKIRSENTPITERKSSIRLISNNKDLTKFGEKLRGIFESNKKRAGITLTTSLHIPREEGRKMFFSFGPDEGKKILFDSMDQVEEMAPKEGYSLLQFRTPKGGAMTPASTKSHRIFQEEKRNSLPPLQEEMANSEKGLNSDSETSEMVEYVLDDEGFLCNSAGERVLDDQGNQVHLEPEHIEYFKSNNAYQEVCYDPDVDSNFKSEEK